MRNIILMMSLIGITEPSFANVADDLNVIPQFRDCGSIRPTINFENMNDRFFNEEKDFNRNRCSSSLDDAFNNIYYNLVLN